MKTHLETRVDCSAANQLNAAVHWTLRPAQIICICPGERFKVAKAPATLRSPEHLHLTETKIFGVGAVVPDNKRNLICFTLLYLLDFICFKART